MQRFRTRADVRLAGYAVVGRLGQPQRGLGVGDVVSGRDELLLRCALAHPLQVGFGAVQNGLCSRDIFRACAGVQPVDLRVGGVNGSRGSFDFLRTRACGQFCEPRFGRPQGRLCLCNSGLLPCCVQTQNRLAGGYGRAFAHQDLIHDAAGRKVEGRTAHRYDDAVDDDFVAGADWRRDHRVGNGCVGGIVVSTATRQQPCTQQGDEDH